VIGSSVQVGGRFTTAGGGATARRYLAEVQGTNGVTLPWDPRPDAKVRALAATSAGPVVGGDFTTFREGASAQAGIAVFAPLDRTITPTGVTKQAIEGQPFTGVVATFTVPDTGALPGDFSAAIGWGDDAPSSTGTIAGGNGSFTVTATHTYATSGPRSVAVTIFEVDDPSNLVFATSSIDVSPPRRVDRTAFPATPEERPPEPPPPPGPRPRPPVPPH
jgi:hypothetical protein